MIISDALKQKFAPKVVRKNNSTIKSEYPIMFPRKEYPDHVIKNCIHDK